MEKKGGRGRKTEGRMWKTNELRKKEKGNEKMENEEKRNSEKKR